MELLPSYLVVGGVTLAFTVLIIAAHFLTLVYEATSRRRLPPHLLHLPPGVRIDYSALALTTRYCIGCLLHGLCYSGGLALASMIALPLPLALQLLMYWLPWIIGGGAIIALHRWRHSVDAALFGAAEAGEFAQHLSEELYGPSDAIPTAAPGPGGKRPGARL